MAWAQILDPRPPEQPTQLIISVLHEFVYTIRKKKKKGEDSLLCFVLTKEYTYIFLEKSRPLFYGPLSLRSSEISSLLLLLQIISKLAPVAILTIRNSNHLSQGTFAVFFQHLTFNNCFKWQL